MHHSTKRRIMLGMTTGGVLMTGLSMSTAHADATATGATTNSPGIGSGNLIEVPINAPINICGNQIDVIGILDRASHSPCANHGESEAPTPTPTPTGCGCPPHGSPLRNRNAPVVPEMDSTGSRENHGSPAPIGVPASTGSEGFGVAPLTAGLVDSGAFLLRDLPANLG